MARSNLDVSSTTTTRMGSLLHIVSMCIIQARRPSGITILSHPEALFRRKKLPFVDDYRGYPTSVVERQPQVVAFTGSPVVRCIATFSSRLGMHP